MKNTISLSPTSLFFLILLLVVSFLNRPLSCRGIDAMTPSGSGAVPEAPAPPPDGRPGAAGIGTLALSQAPQHVRKMVNYLRSVRHLRPQKGFKGGKLFRNREGKLPGSRQYYEYDVHPYRPGVSRGPERLLTDPSKQHFYYTRDHYNTFIKLQ